VIRIDAGGWGISWAVDNSGKLHQVGLGPQGHTAETTTDVIWYPEAYPSWGDSDPFRRTALRITHFEGTLTTRLRLDSVQQSARADDHTGEHTTITCRDEVFDLVVAHHLLTHPTSGVLEQWIEVTNNETGPIRLHDYDSLALNMLANPADTITQFGGSGWADEWHWTTHGLNPGVTSLASLGGIQPHLQRAPFLLYEPGGRDNERGEALGFSIQWMGNTRFELDLRPSPDRAAPGSLSLRAGANPHGAEYLLEPGSTFATPSVGWAWSSDGRSGVTSSFHRWTHDTVVRDPERLRPIVVNNWETTGMAFDEQALIGLIESAGELGGELFLLDDGWFGTTHPRDDDTQGLGDWDPDPAKLPSGFGPLVAAAESAGIRFGTWVEPEMVNPRSDLYESHPDWVLRDRRQPREHRQQLALDPIIDDVRDFEVEVFDRVLGSTPGISYLKWDANRPVTEPGSTALQPDRQSNMWVDNVRATWAVMDEVVARHPEVELMLCASGGGRNDHGTLRRFHEFWTSDNTDPVARVRMQWACSHFFPASVMAAHVTRWGQRPIEFACAVALSGRFGFDIDLTTLSDHEFGVCRRAVALARRNSEVVQQGDIEHIISPVEGDDRSRSSVAYHHADSSRSVLFAYQLEENSSPAPRIRLRGVEKSQIYELSCTDLTEDQPRSVISIAGDELATDGLGWPLETPCTALIWELNPT
jgi:alpha-galactosidase